MFITFEALDVHVLVYDNPSTQRVMNLLTYLGDTTSKLVLGGFILKAYPKDRFLFRSYKVDELIPKNMNLVN